MSSKPTWLTGVEDAAETASPPSQAKKEAQTDKEASADVKPLRSAPKTSQSKKQPEKKKPGPKGTRPARTQNVPIDDDLQKLLDRVKAMVEKNSFAGSISERKILTQAVKIGLEKMERQYGK